MYIGIGPSGLGCCLATLLIAVLLCLPAAAFGQSSHGRVSPAAAKAAAAKADADLLAEFKAGAAVGKRTEAELQADAAHVVDLLLRALADAGKSRYRSAQARSDLGRVCRNSLKADDDRVRQAVMKALAETLSRDANSPPEIQATVAQYLQDYGAAECVEPLAGMLAAGDTDRRELARMTLETINVPAAGEKLRSAMFSAVDPNWQIALMNSLGAQGGNASVRWIARMMKVPNASVVAAAAAALGDIGTADAVAVLVAGGDGTVREAVEGLLGRGVPLYHLPLGNENLFAKALGMTLTPSKVLAALENRRSRAIDVVRINGGRLCIACLGAGFDGNVVRLVAANRNGPVSDLDYVRPIWQTLWKYRFPSLRVDADDGRAFEGRGIVMAGNLPTYAAGLPVFGRARPDDGLLDVLIVPCRKKGEFLKNGILTLLGKDRRAGAIRLTTRCLKVSCDDECPVQVDGDVGPELPIEASVLAGALAVLEP